MKNYINRSNYFQVTIYYLLSSNFCYMNDIRQMCVGYHDDPEIVFPSSSVWYHSNLHILFSCLLPRDFREFAPHAARMSINLSYVNTTFSRPLLGASSIFPERPRHSQSVIDISRAPSTFPAHPRHSQSVLSIPSLLKLVYPHDVWSKCSISLCEDPHPHPLPFATKQ